MLEINEWFTKFNKTLGKYLGLYKIINILQCYCHGYVGLRVLTDRFGSSVRLIYDVCQCHSVYVDDCFTRRKFHDVHSKPRLFGSILRVYGTPERSRYGREDCVYGRNRDGEFENVTFSYPKSDQVVLDNISFSSVRRKISIVGLNGAGKTTLIKLLCRLYRPTSGTIKINGKNIYDYDHTTYMKQIAAVFQDYKVFAFSIEENITCLPFQGDERAKDIVRQVGLEEKVKSLPNGMASYFGKAYDESGIEMSGGESQKIAIARALYKDASLIILNEPTSALDPLAEAEVYSQFNGLVGEKTAIYISHRMSSSVFCDKVLVIEAGKVVDYDHHQNLMKKTDSLYYKMFQAQAENYQLN